MAVTSDFYTYRQDIRPFGGGSVITYTLDPTVLVMYQGEFCALKVSGNARTVVRFVADGSAGDYVGISRDSLTGIQTLGNQVALTAKVYSEFSVFTTGVHQMKTTVGETYNHGKAVYMGADTATVTTSGTSGQPTVGMVFLPDNQQNPVIGAASQRVPILIDEHTINQVGSVG
jgi:hypothetical protein